MRSFIDIIQEYNKLIEDSSAFRIPTRLPTGKTSTEDPNDPNLRVDIEAAKLDRKSFEHNVNLLKGYNVMPKAHHRGSHDRVADRFADHVKSNLLSLHDRMPEHHRERARKWYDGANKIAQERADEYGLSVATTAAVYAALSPQKAWHENASIGDRVLDAYLNRQSYAWTPEMEETARRIWSNDRNLPIYEAIRAKRLSDLPDLDLKAAWIRTFDEAHSDPTYPIVQPEGTLGRKYTNGDAYGKNASNASKLATVRWGTVSEIAKAVAVIEANGNMQKISRLMGERHKVRNFYSNVVNNNSENGEVTIDTHAVAAGLLQPLGGKANEVAHNFKNNMPAGTAGFIPAKGSAVTGVQGTYPFYADGYRRAAAERNILPREMQSITWEAAKGLFDGFGNAKGRNLPQIKDVWKQYSDGKISADEAREMVYTISGGINAPDWAEEDNGGEKSGGQIHGTGNQQRSGPERNGSR